MMNTQTSPKSKKIKGMMVIEKQKKLVQMGLAEGLKW
jgi:hypothetical protein